LSGDLVCLGGPVRGAAARTPVRSRRSRWCSRGCPGRAAVACMTRSTGRAPPSAPPHCGPVPAISSSRSTCRGGD